MKSFNKVLAVVAVSMTAFVGVSANAQQPYAGEQPVFENLSSSTGSAVNATEVQAQARQAMADNALTNSEMNKVVIHSQASELSRAQVHAQAVEAAQNNRIAVGE